MSGALIFVTVFCS